MNKPVTLHECDLVYLLNSKYHQSDHPCCCWCGSPWSPWSDWINSLQEQDRQASSSFCGRFGPRGNSVSSILMKKQNQTNTKNFHGDPVDLW
ncbi:hypothetical protein AMECASPLE_032949 [Ameca splendens]|uniref:Uncharacterized protein n=1 Tax=Ameca splendens TaxID=208324 RepID=A0ABV0YVB4_9TELE